MATGSTARLFSAAASTTTDTVIPCSEAPRSEQSAAEPALRRLATSRLNFEITAWLMDPAFAAWMSAMFVTDFEESRVMNQDDLIDRPWWLRVGSRAAYLLAPVL